MSGWRYIATRLTGDGTEEVVYPEVPLNDAEITEDLSGPGGISGTISPEVMALKTPDGRHIFEPWATAIYAEKDGQIRGGGIIGEPEEDGQTLILDGIGLSGYPKDIPYTQVYSGVDKDPLDIVRLIWDHVQAQPGGNIGMVVDQTTSKRRIGTPAKDVEFETSSGDLVAFESGPYKLNPAQTLDLGKEIDDLAVYTPFEYLTDHAWNAEGTAITHRLRLGVPRLGRRLHELTFIVGENIFMLPAIQYSSEDYASEVLVLGAGEGLDAIRGTASRQTTRLRRVAVVQDKSIRSKAAANKRAEVEVNARMGLADLGESIVVENHPHAPLGTFRPGDEILIQTSNRGWAQGQAIWSRIISVSIDPEADTAQISVVRS